MDDQELDLAQREADLAIRMRAPVQADLIQRKLFTVHYHMYAAKAYLKDHPAPKTLEEIADHTIIVYGETAAPEIRDINWLLEALQEERQARRQRPASSASTTSPASCRRWKRAWGSAWCRIMSRPSIPTWSGCCRMWRRRASTCIWSMPMPCASPSAWRRSAISLVKGSKDWQY